MSKRPESTPLPALFEELEPRLLLSADGLAGLGALVSSDEHELDGHGGDVIPVHQEFSPARFQGETSSQVDAQVVRRELVFVDAGIEDHEALVEGFLAASGEELTVDVIVLDPARDGIEQIAEALAGYQDLDAVHVLSHGDDASLRLGSATLDAESLDRYREAITGWGAALDSEADLLFYGCNLAAGEDGRELVAALADLTGADVAASDDLTGSTLLGGDWELEYRAGDIEAAVAPSAALQASYRQTLAVINGTAGDDVLLGTAASDVISAGAGDDVLVGNGGSDQLLGEAGNDVFRFTGATNGDVYTVDGGSETDTIDLTNYNVADAVFADGKISIDTGPGFSFEINYSNIDSVQFADVTATVLTGDTGAAGFSGSATYIEGGAAFTVSHAGGGTIDWSYVAATNSLSISDTNGTSASSSITITGHDGANFSIDSIASDGVVGSLTTNVDIGQISFSLDDSRIDDITVSNGAGNIGSITYFGDMAIAGTVTIDANVGTFALGPGLDIDSGTFLITGDLRTVDVPNFVGGTLIAERVIGQFDSIADSPYSDNFATPTKVTLDGSTTTESVPNVVSDLSSGIELNTDGGNDAYLVSASGLSQSLSATTAEIRFAASNLPLETTFMSFNTPAGDEFTLQLNSPGGPLQIDFGGGTTQISTAVDYSTLLLDGELHTLSVSWDSTNGDWAVYVDGDLIDSGDGLSPGAALDTTNGRFVFGQEQDSVLGGFQSIQYFSGTLYDVRIWDHVRSADEIALSHQSKFDSAGLPAGLVANWQMDGFNGSNEVVDVVSGNNLSIGHAAGAGFIASTPVEDLNIDENSANGTRVGFVVPGIADPVGDVVSDGNFTEAGTPGSNTTYYANGSGAGSVLGDWTVTNESVDLTVNIDPPPLGGNSVDLSGDLPGTISQTLATTVGRQYQVVFELTGAFHGGAEAIKQVRVSADAQSADFSIAEGPGWDWSTNALWETRSFTFTASSAATALSLESLNSDGYGPLIANVRVLEVPSAVQSSLTNDVTLTYDAATNKFYRLVSTPDTFSNALGAATSSTLNGVSGQLGTIRSSHEQQLFDGFQTAAGTDIWLGASDATTEGEWHWLDGAAETDQFWTGGNGGSALTGHYVSTVGFSEGAGEDYLRFAAGGTWADQVAGNSYAYVVEWDADRVLSSYAFSLTDDAGGRFAIDSSTGEITVANGSLLDYEAATSHDIDVQVTDAGGDSYSEVFTVSVNDVSEANQAPSVNATAADTGTEDVDQVYTHAEMLALIGASDVDDADANLSIAISNVVNGTLALSGGSGGAGTTFTFTPTLNFMGNLTFDYQVSDDEVPTPASSAVGTATVTLSAVNDNPTGSGSLTTTSLNDNAGATNLFGGLTVSDVDVGEVDLSLTITLTNAAAGTISGGGFTDLGGGVYRATGLTVAQADTALDNVQFTPADNTGPSGTFTTDISVTVNDQDSGEQSVLAPTTVTITRVNDNPAGSGSLTTTSLNDNAGATNLFGGLTVSDVDVGENDLSLTITLTNAGAGTISGGGFVNLGGGVYRATGLTVAAANTALDNVQFTPTDNTGPSGTFVTDISVTVNDQGGGGEQGVLGATTVTITRVNDNPGGSGSLTTTSLNDNVGATNLFGGLSVSDADAVENDLSVTITLTNPAAGTLSGGGFVDLGGGVYRATGLTAAQADTALDNVTVTPPNNTGPSGTFATDISVTVNDQDSGEQSVLGATTLTVTRVNDNPTGSGTLATISLNDNAGATNLFGGLTVSDVDVGENDLSLTITLTNAGAGTISGGGFVALGGGVYRATGLTVAAADTALDNVTFTPTDNTGPSGSFATDISVTVNDQGGGGEQGVLGATTVTITRVNDNPAGSGSLTTTSLNDNAGATNLFGGLTVSDVDAGENDLSVTITLTNPAAGTLSGGGFVDLGGGVYRATGLTVAQADTALDNVQFTPPNNTGPSGTFATDISVTVNDQDSGEQSVLGATTLTITRVNDNPTGSGSLTTTSLNDNAGATNLFGGLTVSDVDAGENDLSLTITLTNASAGTISGGGFVALGGGVYRATGLTVAAADTALDNVQFTPTDNSGPSGTFATDIGVTVNDQGGGGEQDVLGATTLTITRVNDNPGGAGTLTTTSLNDNAGATNLFGGLTVSDVDAGENDLSVTITLTNPAAGTLSGGGFVDLGGGVYRATGLTVAQADTALDNVTFTPPNNTGPSGTFATDISVTVNDQDSGEQSVLGATTLTITRVNDNPTGSGSLTTTSLNDNAGATSLFGGLTVSDVDVGENDLSLTITLTNLGAGTISGGGFVDLGGGVYRATGLTVAQADTALDNVQFTPTNNSGPVNLDISVTVNDQDSGEQSVLAPTTVTITGVNDDPTGSGSLSTTSLNDNAGATNLFGGLTVSDVDTGENDLSLTITLTNASAGTISGGGFLDLGGGVYRATGLTVAAANTALDNVTFTPTDNTGPAGSFATDISVSVNDQGGGGEQSVLGATTVTITRVNDNPGGAGTLTTNSLNDNAGATNLFGGLTVSDVDAGENDLSVTITLTNPAAGTLTGGGFVDLGGGVYRATGLTAAQADTALDNVTFTPPDNTGPSGTFATDISVTVNDQDSGEQSVLAATTLTITRVNDDPTGSGTLTTTSLNDNAGATNLFGGLTVSDVDVGENDLSLTITLTNLGAGTISGGGFVALGGGVYRATGLTVAQADTALDNVTFTPTDNSGSSGSFATDISVTVNDQGGGGEQSVLGATTLTITLVNDNPTGSGSLSTTSLNDNAGATNLFGGLTVSDVDVGENDLSVTITLTNPAAGSLSGGGFVDLGGGVYRATGLTAAAADTALDNVQFTPTDNTGPAGSFATDISVTVNDQGGGGEQSVLGATTVTITRVNDNPGGAGTLTTTSLNDNAGPTNLFGGLTVSDVDAGENDLSVTITLTNPAAGTLSGGGFVDLGGGVYRATGLTVAQADTALDNVQFTPPNNTGPSGTFATDISVTVNDQDGGGEQGVLGATTLTIARVNDDPTGSGTLTTTSLNDNAGATNLFGGLTVSDVDAGENDLSLTITLTNAAAGTLSGGGFVDLGGGVYRATGLTVAAANTALDNVQFTPTDNTAPSGTFATDISVTVNDQDSGEQSVLGATTLTITRVNDNPTGSGTLTTTSLNDNAGATNLFGGLTVSDVDAGENDLSLTITLTNAGAGTISGGGFVDLGGGVYRATGLTVAAANTALDNVQFTPTDNTGSAGSFATDISVTVNDQGGGGEQGVLGATTVTITRVNDNPGGSGSLTTTSLNDNVGATNLFGGLSVSDADAGENDLSLTITLTNPAAGTLSGGGFVDLGGGVYRATGLTAAQADTALDNVTFTPVNNTGPSGTFATDIGVTVNDQDSGEQSVLAATTLTITRVNDDPTGSGSLTTTSLNDNAGATNLFGGLSVSDVDTGENDLSLTITLTNPAAGTISGGGFVALGGGVYRATGLTVSAADTALDNVQFTPTDNTGPSGSFATDISVTVNDQGGGGEQGVFGATTLTITRVNDNPGGAGALTTTNLNDNAGATNLFGGLTVSDVDAGENDLSLTITLTNAGAGAISGGGFVDLGGGVYRATGLTVAAADTALDNVTFTPTDNTGSSGSFATDISVTVNDQGGGGEQGVLGATTVTITRVNDNPGGSGSLTTTSLNDNAGATNLFGGLTVSDVDAGENDLSLTITLTNPAAGTLSGGGFVDLGGGVYRATGLTVAQADTALDNVTFTPPDNTGPSGTFATDISVTVNDQDSGEQSVLAATTVTITRVNDNPGGSGSLTTTSLNDNAGATNLFGGLTVSDVDTGENDLSLTITLTSPSAGTISGGGFVDLGGGVYRATGLTVAQADTALDNVQFTPTNNTGPSGSFATDISVTVNDQGGGGERSVLGVTTVTITRINVGPVGQPVITGTPTEDLVLSANTGGISDADGLGPFSYQWLRDGLAIGAATGASYTLGDADVGASITVRVDYIDGDGLAESVISVAVGPVVNVNDLPTGQPVITGTPTEDLVLVAGTAGIADVDGLGPFSNQWLRDGVAIAGATGSTYTLGDADVGGQISMRVSYTDGHGTPEVVTSAQTAPVANVNDVPSGAPVVSGALLEGATLSADGSGIGDADGLGAFGYQWLRDGVAIGGATGATYTLGESDVGRQIRVAVSYTDAHGTPEGPIGSAPTALVLPRPVSESTPEPPPVAEEPEVEPPPAPDVVELSTVLPEPREEPVELTGQDDPEPEGGGVPPDSGGFLERVVALLDAGDGSTPAGNDDAAPGASDEARTLLLQAAQERASKRVQAAEIQPLDLADARTADAALVEQVEQMVLEMTQRGEQQIVDEEFTQRVLKGTLGTLSVGTVTWLLRAGSLLTGVFSVIPMWTSMDPLPILAMSRKEKQRRQKELAKAGSEDAGEQRMGHLLGGQTEVPEDREPPP